MEDQQKEARYMAYRRWSNLMTVSTVVFGLALMGLGLSLLLQRPWSEGLAFGFLIAGGLVTVVMANTEFMTYWEAETRKDFEAEEEALEDAWERERNRPDDEYVGW